LRSACESIGSCCDADIFAELELESASLLSVVAAVTCCDLLAGKSVLVGGSAGEVLRGVSTPGLCALGAALVISVEHGDHGPGQGVAVSLGDGVHSARPVVVRGDDGLQSVGGSTSGTARHLVDALVWGGLVLVGFVGLSSAHATKQRHSQRFLTPGDPALTIGCVKGGDAIKVVTPKTPFTQQIGKSDTAEGGGWHLRIDARVDLLIRSRDPFANGRA
jgi:hypothetical protein